jgi:hypothetical protein
LTDLQAKTSLDGANQVHQLVHSELRVCLKHRLNCISRLRM